MRYIRWNIILSLILLIGVLSNLSVNAEPTAEVTVEPDELVQLSTVSFSATVTSEEEIESVILYLKECNPTICHPIKMISLTLDDEMYKGSFELEYDDATYISYMLKITAGGTETETDWTDVDVSAASINDNDDDDGGNDSPGFEIIVLLIAVFITIALIKRKR